MCVCQLGSVLCVSTSVWKMLRITCFTACTVDIHIIVCVSTPINISIRMKRQSTLATVLPTSSNTVESFIHVCLQNMHTLSVLGLNVGGVLYLVATRVLHKLTSERSHSLVSYRVLYKKISLMYSYVSLSPIPHVHFVRQRHSIDALCAYTMRRLL